MDFSDWRIRLGAAFAAIAAAVNTLHYLIFRDAAYLGKFILAQLGFMPVSVFLVTVVINQLLGRREKQALLKKMNMVVGAFFIEIGNSLLLTIAPAPDDPGARRHLLPRPGWSEEDFAAARKAVEKMEARVELPTERLVRLRELLHSRRDLTLKLLANPNLLEHDSFTDLLWAVVHLDEELASRSDLSAISAADLEHLKGDVTRVTGLLVRQWLDYMAHLAEDYPYLFSLAVRTNPFDPERRAEIG